MNINDIRNAIASMPREELEKIAENLAIDCGFGIMTRGFAQAVMSTIEADQTLIMMDLANIHAANHLYTMDTVDQFIDTVLSHFRNSDTWIKWGGDEIVIVLNGRNAEHITEFVNRLDAVMAENNLYAVYGIVKTTTNLKESVKKADRIVSATKLMLEQTGQKPSRDEEYRVLPSVTVYE